MRVTEKMWERPAWGRGPIVLHPTVNGRDTISLLHTRVYFPFTVGYATENYVINGNVIKMQSDWSRGAGTTRFGS
jgi:hypothetical protein